MEYKHSYIDISYHGSPTYQCKYCDKYEWDVKGTPYEDFCDKAEEALKKQAELAERKEFAEYKEIKEWFDRWKYLKNKYSSGD